MIELLDVKTLTLVLVLGHAIAALLLFFDSWRRANRYDVLFMIAMVLQSIAWYLIFLRETIPDVFSFGLGNSIIFVGFCLEGICLLSLERPINRIKRLFYASVLTILLIFWWIPGLSQNAHMGIGSFIVPLFFGFPALFLISSSSSRSSPLRKIIGATILCYIFATIFRGAFVLMAGSYSLTVPIFYQILFLLTQVAFMVLVSTGYILLRKECVCENLEKDIAKRKQLETTLQESERRLTDIISFFPDATLVIDKSGTVLAWNRAMEKMTGVPADQMIGRGDYEHALPFYHERRPILVDLVLHDDPEIVLKYPFVKKEGKNLFSEIFIPHLNNGKGAHLWFTASPLYDATGNITGAIESIRDITERKRTEDVLRKANRQLNLLSGITRHDILNQVTALTLYLAVIKEDFKDPALTVFLDKIQPITDAIRTQIAFTRVYQDLGSQEPRWEDVKQLLDRLNVPATITLNADVEGIEIFSDPMFEKVFFTLLDNSIRHGEHVTLIRVSSSESDEGLTIVWEDNGIGIPIEEKKSIFKRGFGKNTGLGLFLVHEILALTDITIQETGEPGKGARFEIMVPKGAWRQEE